MFFFLMGEGPQGDRPGRRRPSTGPAVTRLPARSLPPRPSHRRSLPVPDVARAGSLVVRSAFHRAPRFWAASLPNPPHAHQCDLPAARRISCFPESLVPCYSKETEDAVWDVEEDFGRAGAVDGGQGGPREAWPLWAWRINRLLRT